MTFENMKCFFPMPLFSSGHFVFTVLQLPEGDAWSQVTGWRQGFLLFSSLCSGVNCVFFFHLINISNLGIC